MQGSATRSVLSELVIGVALCVGVYALWIEPIERKLAVAGRLEDEVAAERRRLEGSTLEPAEAKKRLEAWAARAKQLEALNQAARSEAELVSASAELARRHSVRIDQVQPERVPPEAGAKGGEHASRLGQSITVSGSYPAVVAFLDGLERDLGLTRIKSVQVSPTGLPGSHEVTAVIRSEHFAFELAGVASVVATAAPEGGR